MGDGRPCLDLGAWAARVSDDGILVVPVGVKPELEKPSFVGEPKLAPDGWPEHMGMQFGEGESSFKVEVGDAVYMTPARKGAPCEIGFLTSCYADKQGYPWFTVQWLWQPTVMFRRNDEGVLPHELLLGTKTAENPYESLEMCVRPVCPYTRPSLITRLYFSGSNQLSPVRMIPRSLRLHRTRSSTAAVWI